MYNSPLRTGRSWRRQKRGYELSSSYHRQFINCPALHGDGTEGLGWQRVTYGFRPAG